MIVLFSPVALGLYIFRCVKVPWYNARLKFALNKLPIALISLLIYIIISKFCSLVTFFFFFPQAHLELRSILCRKQQCALIDTFLWDLCLSAIWPLSPEWPVESHGFWAVLTVLPKAKNSWECPQIRTGICSFPVVSSLKI